MSPFIQEGGVLFRMDNEQLNFPNGSHTLSIVPLPIWSQIQIPWPRHWVKRPRTVSEPYLDYTLYGIVLRLVDAKPWSRWE